MHWKGKVCQCVHVKKRTLHNAAMQENFIELKEHWKVMSIHWKRVSRVTTSQGHLLAVVWTEHQGFLPQSGNSPMVEVPDCL